MVAAEETDVCSMRPINNIVDITNFVMLEYGQPLHAFDINQVKGGKIVVENAKDGEVFTTLDGTERTLTDDMLLIKDAERGIAIAGVMGGLNSEIEEDTKTIIVESANFAGNSVRTTSKNWGCVPKHPPDLRRASTRTSVKQLQTEYAG